MHNAERPRTKAMPGVLEPEPTAPTAHHLRRGLLICLVGIALACGGSAAQPLGATHQSGAERPLEMTVRTPAGEWIHIGDLRGQPVLLFLFATFDGRSQASLRPLARFARRFDDVHVLGIAVQPNARQLLDAYQSALQPPFPLTYDPTENISEGTSPLGNVTSVPQFLMFDARGVKSDEHIGFPNTRTFPRMRERALQQADQQPQDEVPLLGVSSDS